MRGNNKTEWEKLPQQFSNIELDVFAVMPNHFHGIVMIQNENNVGVPLVGTQNDGNHNYKQGNHKGLPTGKKKHHRRYYQGV